MTGGAALALDGTGADGSSGTAGADGATVGRSLSGGTIWFGLESTAEALGSTSGKTGAGVSATGLAPTSTTGGEAGTAWG